MIGLVGRLSKGDTTLTSECNSFSLSIISSSSIIVSFLPKTLTLPIGIETRLLFLLIITLTILYSSSISNSSTIPSFLPWLFITTLEIISICSFNKSSAVAILV